MPTELTDTHFEEFCAKGYLIVPDFTAPDQCREMAAALRRLLKPWEEVKDGPSPPHTAQHFFPYPEPCLNEAILNPIALQFARRWHDTHHIHYRQGLAMARYPGFKGDVGHPHIDNGNNSLLPPTSDQRHAQIV